MWPEFLPSVRVPFPEPFSHTARFGCGLLLFPAVAALVASILEVEEVGVEEWCESHIRGGISRHRKF